MALLLGIDTGGTFTDAVLYDEARKAVLAKAKALTTHGDLALGIGEALNAVLAQADTGKTSLDAASIALVSIFQTFSSM